MNIIHQPIRDAIYCCRLRAGSPENLLAYIRTRVLPTNLAESRGDVIAKLRKWKPTSWLDKAVQSDIPTILEYLEKEPNQSRNIEPQLNEDLAYYVKQLRHLGLRIEQPSLFLMNRFPWPYERVEGWALNIDYVDQERFGLKRGLYLNRRFVARYFSSLLIAHELVHCAVSECRGIELARGVEEGIADLLSLSIAGDRIGWIRAENFLFNTRFECPIEDFWINYQVALRQAAAFYFSIGMKGVVKLLRRSQKHGRNILYDAEASLMDHGVASFIHPAAKEERLASSLTRFLAFHPGMVVSPKSYCLAAAAKAGDSVKDLATRMQVSERVVSESLRELQDRFYIVFVVDKEVLSTAASGLLKAGALRYAI